MWGRKTFARVADDNTKSRRGSAVPTSNALPRTFFCTHHTAKATTRKSQRIILRLESFSCDPFSTAWLLRRCSLKRAVQRCRSIRSFFPSQLFTNKMYMNLNVVRQQRRNCDFYIIYNMRIDYAQVSDRPCRFIFSRARVGLREPADACLVERATRGPPCPPCEKLIIKSEEISN